MVSMLHMSKSIIRCVSAVCMCMVFGIDSHARIDAISTLTKDAAKQILDLFRMPYGPMKLPQSSQTSLRPRSMPGTGRR